MKKLTLIGLLLYTCIVNAQQAATLTENEKNSIIDTITSKLQQYYVFPDTAKKMALYLKKRNKDRAY